VTSETCAEVLGMPGEMDMRFLGVDQRNLRIAQSVAISRNRNLRKPCCSSAVSILEEE